MLLLVFWTTLHGSTSVLSDYIADKHKQIFNTHNKNSIRFKSEDWLEHFNRLIFLIHCFVVLVVYLGALSCWNIQLYFFFLIKINLLKLCEIWGWWHIVWNFSFSSSKFEMSNNYFGLFRPKNIVPVGTWLI